MDWLSLGANALWILGCALALAALSHATWQASTTDHSLRDAIHSGATSLVLHLAGLLFSLGLAFTATRFWETVLWAILGFGVLIHLLYSRGNLRRLVQSRRASEP